MITPNIQPNDERITAPARILAMLKRTFEQHSLLNIRIDGFDDAYSSAILKIGKRHDYLLVDALVPIHGRDSPRAARSRYRHYSTKCI